MPNSIINKFQNIEIYTFEQYFKICTFSADRSSDEIIYRFDIENDLSRTYVAWLRTSLNQQKDDVEVFFGVKSSEDEGMEFSNGVFYDTDKVIGRWEAECAPLSFFKDLADQIIEPACELQSEIDEPKSVEDIFRKHYKLNAFWVERIDKEEIFCFKIENDEREYYLLVIEDSEFPQKTEVCFGCEISGVAHDCFISIKLLRDLARFFQQSSLSGPPNN